MIKPLTIATLLVIVAYPGIIGAQSQPQSQPAPAPSSGHKIDNRTMLQNAFTLLEIYNKIRQITGKNDQGELKTSLDQLNKLLDQILSFKSSFTPGKLSRVERQLNQVQKNITDLGNVPVKDSTKQLDKLTDSIFSLMKAILDPEPDETL